jgi:hypothetical protein
VIVCGEPTIQLSPPFGEVTRNPGIVKAASLESDRLESEVSETLTKQSEDGLLGTVQPWLPSLAVEATIVVHVEPLSVE